MIKAGPSDGKRVVRLKGGDPFIFGRGGEEVEALREAGIEASCRAGNFISAGMRSVGRSAAHPPRSRSDADLCHGPCQVRRSAGSRLGRARQTGSNVVVVFMGVARLPNDSEKLIHAGRASSTPVAVIENGTRDNEIKVFGTLAELPQLIHPRWH